MGETYGKCVPPKIIIICLTAIQTRPTYELSFLILCSVRPLALARLLLEPTSTVHHSSSTCTRTVRMNNNNNYYYGTGYSTILVLVLVLVPVPQSCQTGMGIVRILHDDVLCIIISISFVRRSVYPTYLAVHW